MSKVRWAWGVTTVPERVNTHLRPTLESLARGGFHNPRIFIDGADSCPDLEWCSPKSVTTRDPRVGIAGNWELSLRELFIRDNTAERFVIFQDDLVCPRNLLEYLSRWRYPDKGYWNLYTTPSNHSIAAKDGITGWHLSHQNGRGALGLVFDVPTLLELFTSQHMAARPLDVHRGHKAVDGGVVTALAKHGRKEYVHSPSLLQHTGTVSTIDKRNTWKVGDPVEHHYQWPEGSEADSFPGEDFDLMSLIPEEHRNVIRRSDS